MKDKRFQRCVKRFFDIMVSMLILIPCIPLFLVVAVCIKLTSPGPVFFVQKRPGYGGRTFFIYKFRTMRIGSEKMVKGQEVAKDDVRITAVGHFLRRSKLDELPQIFNVLKGEMSLVGPRPERMESLTDYDEVIRKRLDMLPGMTGLAQVSGNIYISLQERYRLDVYYVEHFSLWLDFRILARTVGVILQGEEKYREKSLIKQELSPQNGSDEHGSKKCVRRQ